MNSQSTKIFDVLMYTIITAGVGMAIFQIIYNRSITLDESSIAHNLMDRGYIELLKPLSYVQMAPIAFLYIQNTLTNLFGFHEVVMRIYPLLCFLASVPYMYFLARRLSPEKSFALLTTALFATNNYLLIYSSEVKQYSSDVLTSIMILYHMHDLSSRRTSIAAAILGATAIWFSNTAVIILFTVGIKHLYTGLYKSKDKNILAILACWILSFAMYYAFFMHNNPVKETMVVIWQKSFLPINPTTHEFYHFLYLTAKKHYAELIGFYYLYFIPLTISAIAIVANIKAKKYHFIFICLFPILTHFILSSLKLYPIERRFLLYAIPMMIMTYTSGLHIIHRYVSQKLVPIPQFTLGLAAAVMFAPLTVLFPFEKNEIKQSLSFMEKNIKAGDKIYIDGKAERAYRYYIRRNKYNFSNHEVMLNVRREYKKTSREKGRFWIIFSHHPEHENQNIIDNLLNKGAKLIASRTYTGSSAFCLENPKQDIKASESSATAQADPVS